MILGVIIFFIFGTIIGSFLNVVILRYNTGRDFVRGRSSCPICRHELGFFELVPVISFAALGGRCKKCLSSISWQYPLVELLTGLVFAAVFLKGSVILANAGIQSIVTKHWIPAFAGMTSGAGMTNFAYTLVIFSLLIVIFVYDLKHKIIPDGLVYAFIILSFLKFIFLHIDWIPAFAGMTSGAGMTEGSFLLDLLAGPIMFLPFFLLWYISSGRWMGFGDAKLAAGIGWFLGLSGAVSAIILGFWIGAAVGIVILFVQSLLTKHRLIKGRKGLTIKSEIPFAPFLIVGLWLVYFFGIDVIGLHLFLIH